MNKAVFGSIVICGLLGAAGSSFASLDLTSDKGVVTEITDLSRYSRLSGDSPRGTIPSTETYTASLLASSTAGAVFLTTGPSTFTYDGTGESAGDQIFTNPPFNGNTTMLEALVPDSDPNDFFAIVEISTDNGADLFPNFTIDSAPATNMFMDVGEMLSDRTAADNDDPITYTSALESAELLSVDVVFFVDNAPSAAFNIAQTGSGLGSIDLATSWGIGGANSQGIDAVQTIFNLRDVPAPGSAGLLALWALAATRRRRG